jgi:hypothetical protein
MPGPITGGDKMDEPRLEELLYRIETLEKENRRWKRIGIGSLCILLVLVVFGGLFVSVGTVVMIRDQRQAAEQARQAEMREREAAEQARYAAEQARQGEMREREAAEQARQAMEAEQRARQAAEKKAKEANE